MSYLPGDLVLKLYGYPWYSSPEVAVVVCLTDVYDEVIIQDCLLFFPYKTLIGNLRLLTCMFRGEF